MSQLHIKVKSLVVSAGLVGSLAVPATLSSPPAFADDARSPHTQGTTTSVLQAVTGENTRSDATASRSGSVVFSVPLSFIDKQKTKCRHQFPHNRNMRLLCLDSRVSLAHAANWKVNNARAAKYWHLYKMNSRLKRSCGRHHHWCATTTKFKGMTVSTCGGPWAPPLWHFRYMCLKWRAGDALGKYDQLKIFTTSTMSPKDVRMIKKAAAAMGLKDNTHMSVTQGLTLWHGPYVNVILKKSTTETVYNKMRDTTDAALVGTLICTIIGSESAGLVTVVCTTALGIALHDLKSASTTAHNEGKCLAFRFYYLSAVPGVGGLTSPVGAADCATSKLALNRTLNRVEKRQAS